MATEEHASGRHGRRSSLSEALIADHDSFAGTKLKVSVNLLPEYCRLLPTQLELRLVQMTQGSDGVMNGFTKQEHVHGSSPADMGGTSVRKQCPNAQNEDLDASPQPSHSSGPSAPSAANPEQLPTGWWQSNADQLHASSLPDRLTVSTGASSSSSSSEQIASYALPKHATTESIDIAGTTTDACISLRQCLKLYPSRQIACMLSNNGQLLQAGRSRSHPSLQMTALCTRSVLIRPASPLRWPDPTLWGRCLRTAPRCRRNFWCRPRPGWRKRT